ncbi:MAG: 4Fe-4S binding protein [Deltaproteobacteria bacterium]|nr:4Fe-4S binding protein [Deltaproteobacteria bacterium]MBW2069638.1 4Fe-4S binding protein [Deltaproteobacteria bacterium]
MRPRLHKRETPTSIQLSLCFYSDCIALHLDKETCIKCDICQTVCPKEAIKVHIVDEQPHISVDPDLCVLCELCSHFCPLSCIQLFFNGEPKKILADQQALPRFPEKLRVDTSKCPQPCSLAEEEKEERWCRQQRQWIENHQEACPKHCHTCLENCPREAFCLEEGLVKPLAENCLRCTLCMTGCDYDAIVVQPIFTGVVEIADYRCPADCTLCIDLCPTNCIVREEEHVRVVRQHCAYCGVCVNICPEQAITLRRQRIYAQEETFSHAWTTAVTKLKQKSPSEASAKATNSYSIQKGQGSDRLSSLPRR